MSAVMPDPVLPTPGIDLVKAEAEIGKLIAEASKLNAETSKLNAEGAKLGVEAYKLSREAFWYPIAVAAGLVGAIAGVTATILKLFS